MNIPRFDSTDASRIEFPGVPVSDPAREVGAQEPGRRPALQKHPHTHAFTLIEIAIAIGVIGFALVAIMGILPFGLEVQRDNRSETIINQDATFWLEAIRNGAQGLDELTNYVDSISIIARSQIDNSILGETNYAYNTGFTSGADIIGLITSLAVLTNCEVVANVTAISGSAAEKEPDASKRDLAFSYILRVFIEPGRNTANSFALLDPANPNEYLDSLHEIRLNFAYPAGKPGVTPPRAQRFRASASRSLLRVPNLSGYPEFYYYFTP